MAGYQQERFTSDELDTLHEMAVNYVEEDDNEFDNCHVFYRNKSPGYFRECQRNGDMMTVYTKDNNGDPKSIINGQIDGLFFATSVDPDTSQPPHWSFFGRRRVSIPAKTMLTRNSNLYFADFYCNYTAHYVTVVLTIPGSEVDRFCEEKLIKLDIRDNDFLYRSNKKVYVTRKVLVEVFYTEDVDLSQPGCTFSTVQLRGKGHSTPGGLPKNPDCSVCNLPREDDSASDVDSLTDYFGQL
ncbi:Phytanoyl-CoA hydroxylase-interacting protein-like [Lamellibrachia satsuma]|nr:Phytanoyl-CoA hydroxylase-interacting protein-like [Lamellibrachia satsuma]